MERRRPRIDISAVGSRPEPSAADRRLLHFAGRVVALGNLLPDHERHGSAIPCRCRPNGRPCRGRLEVERAAQTDHVRWHCPACGDGGLVTGWRGTRWDLTPQLQSGHVVSLFAARVRQRRQAAPSTTRVLRLAAELVAGPLPIVEPVRRQLCIPVDANLHDLHELLRGGFGWHDDGPYEFLFGAPYELGSQRFTGWPRDPGPEHDASPVSETELVALESLALRVGYVFGYVFDFADEWIHRLEVVGIEDVALADARARVTKRSGKAPPQHRSGSVPTLHDLSSTALEATSALAPLRPYDPDRPLPAHEWLALDPAEQLLRVLAAHRTIAKAEQEPAPLLHAVLHCVVEASLARGERAARSALRQAMARGATRHHALHHLGEQLAARCFAHAATPTATPPAEKPARPRRTRATPPRPQRPPRAR